jgi:hypothetical protein
MVWVEFSSSVSNYILGLNHIHYIQKHHIFVNPFIKKSQDLYQ